MPPNVPRKRLREDSPQGDGPTGKGRATSTAIAPPRKPTLFDDLDSTISPNSNDKARKQVIELSDDDSSSLSSLSDADFEDVPGAKRQKIEVDSGKDDEDEDEDIEFEDVSYPTLAPQQFQGPNEGALELTLSHVPTATYADFGGKKGPSKKERQARIATHCMHVQFLMWHNAVRNAWLCDPLAQGIVLSHLPPGMWDEIERFRRSCGLDQHEEPPKKSTKKVLKGKAKGKASKASEKAARDWGGAAQRLENGAVDLSHGDPLFRLVRSLSAWWRKRFRVTAPGIRKMGYMQTRRCANLIKGFNEGGINPGRYGERISSLQWFRLRAQECTGSRDVGAQLFTCLLRALGLEARMVANLQPVGFGFNKSEEAEEDKIGHPSTEPGHNATVAETSKAKGQPTKKAPSKQTKASQIKKQPRQSGRSLRKQGRRSLKEESDESNDDDLQLSEDYSDDNSAVDIPPLTPTNNSNNAKFDRDLEFPHYWTEVLSPATQKYVPVDVIIKNIVGTNRDLIESLGPRGAKADKAKQVMAYIVGFSQDGTAKDVTVRYLKGQLFPGRTKGTRMPLEKIPVYNKMGKVKRYDHFDWFKSVMRAYTRGGENYPLTEVDYDEEATDLKIAQPVKKEVKEGEETLQYFKSSKEFVLGRHLKREEALLPTAKPVKYFKNKGKKGDGEEEPVYLRKDVVQVKSEETWHKQGRVPRPGAQPLKRAPYRAATTNRRRELAEAEAAAGHKVLQGLYSHDQTDWIIPPPIQNGIIPKNQYGNIDLFVEHMLPQGAAHVPYRGAIRVCRRLEIDFAEAVVDFEFGHRMAVPVIQGVVIPEEHYDQVMEEVAKDEAEKARKEDEKRRKVVLGAWRKLLMGLRIVERVRREYGGLKDTFQVFGHSRDDGQDIPIGETATVNEEDMAGGFLPGGFDEAEEEEEADRGGFHKSSFFPAIEDEEDEGDEGDGGLVIEDGAATTARVISPARESSERPPQRRAPRRGARRRGVPSSDEEEEDDENTDSDGEYVG
ncbi:rad4 family protein [Diaporthe amygdali]|uniref:rad4 family protein n=1 Tax=Phomopsis amygdali TaxID=1214568 RepID=UPI0022FDCCC6|nr:rad4 family protein [Diaporthe amygdali]KAJ0118110.1 rad4 family protein [Diaporthe amygdali]